MLYKPKDLQPTTALTLRLIFLLLPSVISYRRHQVFFARSFRPGELRQQVPAWILTLPLSQPCSNTLGALGSSEWFPPAQEHPPSTHQAHQSGAEQLGPSINHCCLTLPHPSTTGMLTTNIPSPSPLVLLFLRTVL